MSTIDTSTTHGIPRHLDLHDRLERFARVLAAEQWYESSTYESSVEDKIGRAIAECKASIGDALLQALGVAR